MSDYIIDIGTERINNEMISQWFPAKALLPLVSDSKFKGGILLRKALRGKLFNCLQ